MATITKPHGDFAALTTAESAKVNAQINTIYTLVNGGLDDANITALANINQQKILNLVSDLAAIRAGAVREIAVQVFTTTVGTSIYTKPSDLLFAHIICVGAGGGGGGPGLATATRRTGGGGGGGEVTEAYVMASSIGATEVVTVGGAGGGGVGGSFGNSGGNSSLGALCAAVTGTGGLIIDADDTEARGGLGGAGGAGRFQHGGNDGGIGIAAIGAHIGGNGGASAFGGGGSGASPGVAAQIGRDFGGGGGGGISGISSFSAGAVGGNGIVIVIEYKS